MSISFGSATTSAFYVGGTAVSAVYQGATQVWAPSAPTGVGTDPTTVAGLSARWAVDSLSATDGTEVLSFPSSTGSATNTTFTNSAGASLTYHAASKNGLPILTSAGTGHSMFTPSTMSPVVGTSSTVFFVGRFSTFASNATLLDGNANNSFRLYASSATQIQAFVVSTGTTAYTLPNNTSWHVFAVRRNGTGTGGLTLWVDGANVASATASSSTTANGLRLFGSGSSTSGAGDVGEVVAYNATSLSDADVLGVTRFLGNKWGVTVA